MRTILLLASTLAFVLQSKAQMTIAAARAAAVGSTVTVTGIVTNDKELGTFIRYFQDGTAGIAAYSSTASVAGFTNVAIGDSITVTGPTKQFNNLLEIDPIQGFTVNASAKPLPAPMVVTPSGFVESTEGRLIQIQNCMFSASGNFASNTNYTLTSSSQTFVMRVVSTATSIIGTPIPTGAVNVTGISSQFCSSPSTGCTTGYQLLPRTLADITSFSGIKESSLASQPISVYPNPASSKISFNVNNEIVSGVTVTDNLGRTVIASKENADHLDVSKLSNGVYFIVIATDKHIYNSKFTIER